MASKETLERIDAMCKNNGFDYAKYLGIFKGEEIFEPSFNFDGAVYGTPRYLHVKDNKIRLSKNFKEVAKVMDFFYD